jgi:hypothetical protein
MAARVGTQTAGDLLICIRMQCARLIGLRQNAAGLPILSRPGSLMTKFIEQGVITHALRFIGAKHTRRAYVFPARHWASTNTNPKLAPDGNACSSESIGEHLRVFTRALQVILMALKKYGMIVADNGSNWFISGAP